MDERQLRDRLHEHLALVRLGARDNEFVDLPRAEELHEQLGHALDDFDDLGPEQQRKLAGAVDYLVRVDDEEDDLRSPIGFDDDAEIIDATLARLRLAPGGTGSVSATT